MKRILITIFFLIFVCIGFVNAQQADSNRNLFEGQYAPLLEGMGDTHFEISTSDVLTQRFFNQAVILTFAFNHATEASKTPDLALESANNLRMAVPGAGHLVHMPSHTYIRVGEYHEGTLANQRAVQTDNDYVAQCNAQGIYPLAYVPHNYHFLWVTATLEAQRAQYRIGSSNSRPCA
jgi:hypothetical protein